MATNFTDAQLDGVPPDVPKDLYRRVWDVTDYVVPPVEKDAFFVTTNIVITPNQVRMIIGHQASNEVV